MLFLIAFSNAQKTTDSLSITTLDSLSHSTGPEKAAAFDTLSGPLSDTVKLPKDAYLVSGDIEVPINKTVIIAPGTVFLFKNFTGLHVQGKLLAQGTKDLPIVFTSENDRSANKTTSLYPNPFDWNGVYIHPDGVGTIMTFCKVVYSVYGIVSETKFIKLDQVALRLNGKSNLVIEGKERTVEDKPYSYILSTRDVMAEGVPVKILKDPYAAKREILRYSSFLAALAGITGTIYCATIWKNSQNSLDQISTNDPAVLSPINEPQWYAARDKRNRYIYYTSATSLLALLGFAGFAWSLTF
ncbi:MAG: hypothetical protein WBM07_09660 [Chitinivibrionales bacterium]